MAGANSYEEAKARMLENIQLVTDEIGPAWQKLARKLRLSEAVITNIDTEYKPMEEKAYQALLKWYHGHGQAKATKKVLCKALVDVGQTIIAEKLGCFSGDGYTYPDQEQEDTRTNICICTHTCISQPDLSRDENGFYQGYKIIGEELDKILKYCHENLTFCDRRTLGHFLKFLEHNRTLNEIIMDSCETNDEEIQREGRRRREHTRQTILLIEEMMKTTINRTRPVSQVLHRCTSEVNLQPRSETFSDSSDRSRMISSPISTSTNRPENRTQSPNRRLHDSISEENTTKAEQLEEQTSNSQCECLSFQVKNCPNQHEEGTLGQNCNQTSKPEPDPDDTDVDIKKDVNDSKL